MASSTGSNHASPICARTPHHLPLRDLIHGIDVVHPFGSLQISLMHRIDTQVSRLTSRIGSPPLADRDLHPVAFSQPSSVFRGSTCACESCINAPPKARPAAHMRPAQTRDTR